MLSDGPETVTLRGELIAEISSPGKPDDAMAARASASGNSRAAMEPRWRTTSCWVERT